MFTRTLKFRHEKGENNFFKVKAVQIKFARAMLIVLKTEGRKCGILVK